MPLYKFVCEQCGDNKEEFRPMKECRDTCMCDCGERMIRDYTIGSHMSGGDKERISTALGVHPSQIASGEAEKLHPGAVFNSRGDMILKNRTEQKRRLKERNWVNRDSYC